MKSNQEIMRINSKWVIQKHDSILIIDPNDLIFIEAIGTYSGIHLKNGVSHKVSFNIGVIADKVLNDSIYRLSRSMIININEINQIVKSTKNSRFEMKLIMSNNKEISIISRSLTKGLIEHLEHVMIAICQPTRNSSLNDTI